MSSHTYTCIYIAEYVFVRNIETYWKYIFLLLYLNTSSCYHKSLFDELYSITKYNADSITKLCIILHNKV